MMNKLQNLEIETERLILRVPRIEDAHEFNKAMNEVWDELQAWMSWAHDDCDTLEATQYYIAITCQDKMRENGLSLVGFDKETGKFVVATGLDVKDELGSDEYSTGYWVSRDFLGKGYATEATKAVLQYAFNHHGAQTMFIDCYEGNDKSRRVIEKCGFHLFETKEKAVERCSDGQRLDLHCYKMDKKDFLTP